MQPFRTLTAVAAPLPLANVNTDDIYPGPIASPMVRAGRMTVLTDPELTGPNAFGAWRWNDDLSPRPEFVLNQSPWDQAGILIARDNFGCGSSREMAVWCLAAIGIRCVIAPSFGDIFYGNCFKSGVLPVVLPAATVEDLLRQAADPAAGPFTVDLEAQTVIAPDGSTHPFPVGAYQRAMLLDGLDEVSATLSRSDAIRTAQARYYAERPWLDGG